MANSIIIHYPFKIDTTRASASQLRPLRIIETFKLMGFDVSLIEGYGSNRKQQIKKIKAAVTGGKVYDFVYSECNTTPTLLTEKHHYPTYPFLDFSFFRFCQKHNIPIGLFYRDIYWCFPENNKGIIRKLVNSFHIYDLRMYNKYVSTLYVPSIEMVSHIPIKLSMPVKELYPGCDCLNEQNERIDHDNVVRMLYVGGIGSNYDLKLVTDVVLGLQGIQFTICCRRDEWEIVKDDYQSLLGTNIRVVHIRGEELAHLYSESDLFCLFVRPDKYREFAVPFKLFETIGYGCPILASEGTWVSKFVERNNIGYTCGYAKEPLRSLLERIISHNDELKEIRRNVQKISGFNTWSSRCEQISLQLTKIKQ